MITGEPPRASRNGMPGFFKETFWSGLFLVVVLGTAAVVLLKILTTLQAVIIPIEGHLPVQPLFPLMWAVVLLLVLVFIAGLTLRARRVSRFYQQIERQLARHIPLFRIAAGVRDDVLVDESRRTIKPALWEDGDKLVPVFLVEVTADGRAAIFIPEASNPTNGSMAIVARDRVRSLDLPVQKFIQFVKGWGAGSDEVLQAIQAGASGPQRSSAGSPRSPR
jgi:uncharacterized membrane protein